MKTLNEKNLEKKEVKKLYRSETDRQIAGVAGGLAEYFQVDSTLIRAAFVVTALLGGSSLLLYLVLWIIIPTESTIK